MAWSWEVWLIIAVVLVLFELLSMDLFFLMLAVGAGVGAIAAACDVDAVWVWVLALVAAAAGLGFLRPHLVERIHRGSDLKIGADALVGSPAVVLSDLAPHQRGRIKIGGDDWTALPADEASSYSAGDAVTVVEIKGATAYVAAAGAAEGSDNERGAR